VAKPVVGAPANGFRHHMNSTALKSPAAKRYIKHDVKAYDIAAYQHHRVLQTGVDDSCKTILEELGQSPGTIPCTCDDQGQLDISTTKCAESSAGFAPMGPNLCTCDDQGEDETSAGFDVGVCK
jgi:hypothetical protein